MRRTRSFFHLRISERVLFNVFLFLSLLVCPAQKGFAFPGICWAQKDSTQPNQSGGHSGIAYIDATLLPPVTFAIYYHVSANYERMFREQWAWRVGYGYSGGILIEAGEQAHGILLMINYLSQGVNKFEVGAGGSLVFASTTKQQTGSVRTLLVPSIAIGYRYQASGGTFFRTGLEWVYLWGFPLHLSVGLTL